MSALAMPDGADLVFEGLGEGDEDFFSEQCGHLNISKAYRELKRVGAPIIQCHVPLEEIPKYRQLRDIDPAHVERLKLQWPQPRLRPVLLGELEPGALTLIDGIHRLIACAEMEPDVNPVRMRAYVVPHKCMPLIRISVYFLFEDGRKQPINHSEYLAWSWGQYTKPGDSPRG